MVDTSKPVTGVSDMHQVAWHAGRMAEISGRALRDARVRHKMTREQLATLLGVSLKTIGNWERDRVNPNAEALVWDVLFADNNPLSAFNHWELLSEVGRRVDDLNRKLEDKSAPRTRGNKSVTTLDPARPTGKNVQASGGENTKGGRLKRRRSTRSEGAQSHGGDPPEDPGP